MAREVPPTLTPELPWWLGTLGALGLGAYVAVPDLPISKRDQLLTRVALVASSAAGAASLAPSVLAAERLLDPRTPLSHRVGSCVTFAASLVTSPLLGDRLVERIAHALTTRGTRWPRVRIGVAVTSTALIGELMQRFPPPPVPKTPPPRRRLVRPSSATIIRN